MSAAPHLRVVRGNPDDVELAAVTAVVVGLASAGGPTADEPRRSAWSDKSRQVRRPLPHGPGAWRSSALPH
ncbi:acyl-CoA carboxylase epsilon subunit-like protein [Saccharothrix saharensis]|uniref:Acyl-CoA carboxylase epsilon subunit-like protein n=1 Tax=Saccharothrix saharensis TaxID=571190 RepID=A0A543JIZ2_9PSEU|nr:acyl-CoA carboxylase subunit epsilon [Saccharothrix saharensis]TQM82744.1 acyl-CoA carboxylase epsilon subunit-like protein [Saccharothrix saharensis]